MTTGKSTRSTTKTTTRKRSTSGTKTSPKSATAAPKTTAKTRKAPASAKVAPQLVQVKEPVVGLAELRKKDLIDQVVERSGLKKKDAKPAVEAALAILGEALAEGRDLNLRPMGKLKIQRSETKSNGTVIVCRVRRPKDSTQPSPDTFLPAAE